MEILPSQRSLAVVAGMNKNIRNWQSRP